MYNEQLNDDDGKVKCEVCGKRFGFISPRHLDKHNLTTQEYKNLYPNAKLAGSSFSTIKKNKNKSIFNNEDNIVTDEKEEEIKNIENELPLPTEEDEDIFMNGNFDDELFLDISENDIEKEDYDLIENIDEYSTRLDFDKKFNDIKLEQKLSVAKYLYKKFPNIQNDYFIRILDNEGLTIKRYITDFADPVNNIVFFFPDVYWHNQEVPSDEKKYKTIKELGWKIVEIKGKNIVDSLKYRFE